MAAAWDYSDYITYERGTSTRLTRLRLHIKEISDYVSTGGYNVQGKSHTKAELVNELARLREEEKELSAITVTSASTNRAPFVRGKAIR